jgi:hypothetical protein
MTTPIEIARRHRLLRAGRVCVAVSVTCVTLVTVVTLVTLVTVVLAGTPLTVAPAAASVRKIRASSHTVWLCRPGAPVDPCATPRTATSVGVNPVRSDFSTAVTSRAKNFDCFYVYPTVSAEPGLNSDLAVQKQETDVAVGQASQFSSVCNVWAPMYKQATQAALGDGEAFTPEVITTAYDSLLAAWRDYLAHDNDGHPVIFIGHSQGAAMLIRLLRSQVDPSASLRKKMVSAIILGGNVQVADGRDVGGSFRHIKTCASVAATSCVIAYSTFASAPGRDAIVGRPGQGVSVQAGDTTRRGQQVACVNPAAFTWAAGDLVPMYPTVVHPVPGVTSPWSVFPQMYTAQCMRQGGAAWLQVDRILPPTRDVGPSATNEGPVWGYHVDDVNLALGNLVLVVAYEEASYR